MIVRIQIFRGLHLGSHRCLPIENIYKKETIIFVDFVLHRQEIVNALLKITDRGN